MPDALYNNIYNPDVLSCLANLSNDEVFTPPNIANAMLDTLPQELFNNPDTTFLDVACKSGIFLREIAKRLLVGLKPQIPDLQERINHIFTKQLYGIAITELTSLLSRRSVYCSKYSNSKYSVVPFDNSEGNIRFRQTQHSWITESGRTFCEYCGVNKETVLGADERGVTLESHAYEFIHTEKPEEIFNMKFDVVISNPPYHLEDAGNGKSAKPIYQLFVDKAKQLEPSFLVMIIPARWYAGGKGLDDFRASMLSDRQMRKLVDYENYKDVFPGLGGLAGGACYFLWQKGYNGKCEVVNFNKDASSTTHRFLNEYDTFIRQNLAVKIVKKITSQEEHFLKDRVSSRKPFGLPTNYEPKTSGIPCWFIQRIGCQFASNDDVTDSNNYLNKWKFLFPKSPIAGQTDFTKPVGFYYDGNTRIAKPGECCTESWLVAGAFDTEEATISYKSYIFTKVARFLLLQAVVSQDVTKERYAFVPDLMVYDHQFSDEELCQRWGITPDEWAYIDSRIGNIGETPNAE